MNPVKKTPATFDEYIAGFPADIQAILEKFRATIHDAIPGAQEAIKYGMPTYVKGGNVIAFAAYKKHIGVYAIPAGDAQFQKDIAPYRAARSTAQFRYDQPIPYELIARMAKFNAEQRAKK